MEAAEAFVVDGPRTGRLADWPLTEDEVTIEVEAVALCQRDAAIWTGSIPRPYPTVLGHEVVGRVLSSPPECGWGPGIRVAGMGNSALARRMRVPAWQVAPVAGSGSHLALVEPLACAVNAVDQDPSVPTSPAVVVGLGLLGQFIAALLAAQGRQVTGIDHDHARLALAEDAGVRPVLASDIEAVDAAIGSARAAYECTANPQVLERTSRGLPPGAALILVAHHRSGNLPAGVLLDLWHSRGLAIRNPVPRTAPDMGTCIRAAAALPLDLTKYQTTSGGLADTPTLLDRWPTGAVMRHIVIL